MIGLEDELRLARRQHKACLVRLILAQRRVDTEPRVPVHRVYLRRMRLALLNATAEVERLEAEIERMDDRLRVPRKG